MSYNGWSNKETWLVNVWFNPETRQEVRDIREMLQEELESKFGTSGFWADFVDLDLINWAELEESLDENDLDEDEDDLD